MSHYIYIPLQKAEWIHEIIGTVFSSVIDKELRPLHTANDTILKKYNQCNLYPVVPSPSHYLLSVALYLSLPPSLLVPLSSHSSPSPP
jgi:hypothetical protein